MAFQNHEGQVRSFQMPAYFWVRRAERSREEGQPVRALRWMSWLAVLLPVIVHFSWSILYHYHSQLAYEQAELAKAA